MTDIASAPLKIQVEGLQYRGPASEATMQAMGGSINYCIDSIGTIFSTLMPIGSIIPSMLTEAQFQGILGADWILAAGQNIVGSNLYNLTGQANAPDLRGRFLRGKNNGASGGTYSPTEESLGAYQQDTFELHSHTANDPGHFHQGYSIGDSPKNDACYGGGWPVNGNNDGTTCTWQVDTKTTGISIANSGSAETRPINITVNYFIRIN